jgi:hypothetical protein
MSSRMFCDWSYYRSVGVYSDTYQNGGYDKQHKFRQAFCVRVGTRMKNLIERYAL